MTDPRDFTSIVQGPTSVGTGEGCAGTDAVLALPCRIEVLCSSLRRAEAARLTNAVRNALGATSACGGPCGLDCWATRSPQTRNLAIVVCAGVRETQLEQAVRARQDAGFELIGVVHLGEDPAAVLPASISTGVALRYSNDIADLAVEIAQLALDDDFQRRAFISYAHADGFSTADVLFAELGRRRFDTYLDRFRTQPGADFVERIQDELVEKSMIVVVESAAANSSRWVQQEIIFAQLRHYGLLAVNIDGSPPHPWISEAQRIRRPTASGIDLNEICEAIERHYRAAQVDVRRRRLADLTAALVWAGVSNADISQRWNGCDVGSSYSISTSSRPPDLRQARRASEVSAAAVCTRVLVGPRPARRSLRSDVDWLERETAIVVVPDGRLLGRAREIAAGTL